MAIILVTGGTGMTGSALTKRLLEKGHEVIILTRAPASFSSAKVPGLSYAGWDPSRNGISAEAIGKADHIIHLAGTGISDKRWSPKRKKEIRDSRVNGAKLIVDSLRTIPNNVKTVITASAIGWYGPDTPARGTPFFVETDPPGKDFLGETCRQWEAAIDPARDLGKRVVKFRTGIIISPAGGVVKAFRKYLKFGIATILGSGRQVTSWIHIEDLVSMYVTAIENPKIDGVYNAVSPVPVTNKELVLAIARHTKHYFISIRVPAFLLKVVLGEMSIEVLKSATVSASKIQQAGFAFGYPEMGAGLVI